MIAAVEGLVGELRRVGIPVRVSESIDAMGALRHIDIGDRETVKNALSSVLVKDSDHLAAFDAIFDLYFATAAVEPDGPPGSTGDGAAEGDHGEQVAEPRRGGAGGGGGAGLSGLSDDVIRQLLLQSVEQDERTLLRALVREVVTRHARIQPGRAVAGTYYLVRTLRAVDPEGMLATLVGRKGGGGSNLDERLLRQDYERRIEHLRLEVESEIRRRLVADRGADAVARTLRRPLPEDVAFLNASREEMVALRDALAPMTRKLASRLAVNRRRQHQGTLDFRATVRRSMSTGGVPLEPVFRRPRPAKPELVVLADISGSVSTFAAFTLQLSYALRSQFAKVRCFVFVDGADEVTDLLQSAGDITEVTAAINEQGRGVWLDGRSDYGNALQSFWDLYGLQLRKRSTVLVLGGRPDELSRAGRRRTESRWTARRAGLLAQSRAGRRLGQWRLGDEALPPLLHGRGRVSECPAAQGLHRTSGLNGPDTRAQTADRASHHLADDGRDVVRRPGRHRGRRDRGGGGAARPGPERRSGGAAPGRRGDPGNAGEYRVHVRCAETLLRHRFLPGRWRTLRLPYAAYVHGNSDTAGAVASIESIDGAMGWARASTPVVVRGADRRRRPPSLRRVGFDDGRATDDLTSNLQKRNDMKLGLTLSGLSPRNYPLVAQHAEAAGFESVWAPEHLVFPAVLPDTYPYTSSGRAPVTADTAHYDPWVTLATIAATTSTIRLATNVFILPLRHPVITARSVLSLDRVSGGRVTLGAGVGWLEGEFEVMGESFKTRGRRTDEIIPLLRRLWSEETVEHHGRYYDLPEIRFEPKPLQRQGIPIEIGGTSAAAMRRAGLLGDGWIELGTDDEQLLGAMIAGINDIRRTAERDHLPFEITTGAPRTIDGISRLAELGVTRVLFRPDPPGRVPTKEDFLTTIDRAAELVTTSV